ncbi:MAG: hypothetical protein HZB67_04970 [Candidatus Aenigmarchaeota archaeon]|nr:hypothetical protein [Candidatus Aenigmarchaeota archaeon]
MTKRRSLFGKNLDELGAEISKLMKYTVTKCGYGTKVYLQISKREDGLGQAHCYGKTVEINDKAVEKDLMELLMKEYRIPF